MTGNKAYLADFQDINGGLLAFGGRKGNTTGKGKIKNCKLDFEDVSCERTSAFQSLFLCHKWCDQKEQGLACLIAKATTDESNIWHRRLGHVNFKNLNRLVKGNLVRGLPTKLFQNDHTCVACQKGKQHKASCKAKLVSSISHTLQLLHMDLFGPTSVRSINHKTYCLVITDDFSRFSWTFFLRTKDETSAILKDFIRQIENQLNQKVKTIRCDNGTEFKNRDVIEFCGLKGIKREYSNARTPQQNGVAERKNRTLIEAARTMLADSFLPNTFWAEAVSTACYVLNRVLVTKPHNKTPYELLTGKTPIISYIRPFGCHVTILNTIDHLGKFAGKSDEGFLVGYSLQSKAFRVYNLVTKRVEENLHIKFLENKPNVAGKGPNWLFDLDYLTDSMNYHSVRSENQANIHAGQQESNQNTGTKDKIDAGDSEKEDESDQDCFELPIWHSYSSTNKSASKSDKKRGGPREEEQVFLDDLARLQRQEKEANEEAEALRKNLEQETENLVTQAKAAKSSGTNIFSTVSTTAKASGTNFVNTVSIPVSTASTKEGLSLSDTSNFQEDDSEIPPLEDIHEDTTDGIFTHSSYDDEGAEADFTNLETVVNVSPIPTSRINPSHPSALILGDPTSTVQTRSKVNKSSEAHAFISRSFEDESWVDARQEVLLSLRFKKFGSLVDLPFGRKWLSVQKWVYENMKLISGVVVWIQRLDWLSGNTRQEKNRILMRYYYDGGVSVTFYMARMVAIEADKYTQLRTQKQHSSQDEEASDVECPYLIGKVTPLFDTMLVQPTQDEGASSERLSHEQPSPSTEQYVKSSSNESLPDSSSAQPSEIKPRKIKLLKAKIKKLKKQAKPVIKSKRISKSDYHCTKDSQGRASQRNIGCTKNKIDHMETENAQSEGRTREMVDEDKECDEDRLSTEDVVSTDKEGVSTDFEKVSTDRPIVSTDKSKVSNDEQVEGFEESNESTEEIFESTEEKVESTAGQREGTEDQSKEEIASKTSQTSTQTPTSMTFGDDETIATLLLNMSKAKAASKEKEKGVELKDVEEIERPRPTSTRSLLTLKPLSKIDPKDKGKKKIEEEDESESGDDDIPQAVKKFKQLESDEELARKIQEEWEAEEERIKIAEEKATNEALIKNFDDIKARIEVDNNSCERELQVQESGSSHRRRNEDVFAIGSVEDDRLIKRMNKKDSSKGEEIKQESKEEVKEEDKGEENTRKRKHNEQDEFWNSQHEWKVVSWKLHSSSGVHTLMTDEGLVVHMLIEKKYPLKKEIVMQMLKLKLESEEESTMALELIQFIKKVLADLESKE
ncbi:putative ribonuclease H-like domain-containing protein [Tanacetum coccineum]